MPLSHVVVLLGYASILIELGWLAVPSVAATWRLTAAGPKRRSALGPAASSLLAGAGFLLPGALCAVPAWCQSLVAAGLSSVEVAAVGSALVVGGRMLTLRAVACLRARPLPEALVCAGPYSRCRNPALLGLELFLLGAVLVVPGPATAAGAVVYALHMHGRVRAEEDSLLASAGAAYTAYCRRVPRYVPAVRRRAPS